MISRSAAPPAVKRLGRRVSRAVGERTAEVRMLPDFLLVGAQRAGTTALHRALAAHPAVVSPLFHKGVNYFDVSYHRGPRWYRGHFPVRALAERRVGGTRPQTFDASGYYMFHPCAPERISRDLPGVRLLVMVRDPVERAYSQHKHEVMRGFEPETSFDRALELEPERLAGEVEKIRADPRYESVSHRHHSYLAKSRYAEQIAVLFDLFGRDRVHVFDNEEFSAEPQRTFDGVLRFLDLPPFEPEAFGRWNARPREPLAPLTRRRLEEYFAPHDDALEQLLGRPLAWRSGLG